MNTETSLIEWLPHVASKGALVLGVGLLAGVCLRRVAAARRYAVWLAALGALALLPLAMAVLPAWRVLPMPDEPPPLVLPQEDVSAASPADTPARAPAAPAPAKAAMAEPTAAEPSPSPAHVRAFLHTTSWHTLWVQWPVLWLAGSVVMLLRLAWGAWRLRRLEKALPQGACGLLGEVASDLGLRHAPCVLLGAPDAVPMVWGLWRPRLLLPRGFDTWDKDKLRSVLLHELAHLQRHDPLALWLAQAVKALHWFNPLAWLTFRQLRADQERACDDTVLRHGVRPSDYAQHLLDLSRQARIAPGLALCALTITRCAPVEARVRAVLDVQRPRQPLTRRWQAGMAALALLTALPVAMLHAIEGLQQRGRILDRNGVVLAESTAEKARHYPLRQLASHVVGYVGKPAHDAPALRGRAGVEREQDALLADGKDVVLALDGRIQALAARAMQEAGCRRGAAVVLDPRTGEILAAVSLPAYDASLFVPTISRADWETLLQDADLPLFNRCVQGRYAPGAAFMPLTALAGISAGVGEARFRCQGSVTYGSRVFKCWKFGAGEEGHGLLGMTDALFHSCNCYWYQFGNQAGVDAIARTGRLLGFDAAYGVAPEESAGVLPTPQWLASHQPQERWTPGSTANLAIGQGALTTSPLHLAVLAATVAQRGRVPQPTWKKIEDREEAKARADLVAEGWKADQIEQVREGMRQVVNKNGGTGRAARSDKVVIAGKTGTAQAWRRVKDKRVEDNNTWFIGFAPYDKPTLAFAILKQGGKSGGSDCAPIARRIVEEALALPADGSGEVKPLDAGQAKGIEKPRAVETASAAHIIEMGRAVDLAREGLDGDVVITQREVTASSITLDGSAGTMLSVLRFCEKLEEQGAEKGMTWNFPLPVRGGHGQRFIFRAEGTGPADTARPGSTAQVKVMDASVRLRPADEDRWQGLQRQGNLAPLPAGTVAKTPSARDKLHMSGWFFFRFTAPRAAVHSWLVASLSEKMREQQAPSLLWPEAPAAFNRTYQAANECEILIQCDETDRAYVSITKKKPRILIAPDEATPPTPKTAAPRELEGFASAKLNARLYRLLPKPPVERETRLPAFPHYLSSNNLSSSSWAPQTPVPVWPNDSAPLNSGLLRTRVSS